MCSGMVTPQLEVVNFTYCTFNAKLSAVPNSLSELLTLAKDCGSRVGAVLGIWVEHCGLVMFVLYDINLKEYVYVAKDKWYNLSTCIKYIIWLIFVVLASILFAILKSLSVSWTSIIGNLYTTYSRRMEKVFLVFQLTQRYYAYRWLRYLL